MIAHIAFPAVTLAQLAAELAREADARASLYARRVEAARMTEDEAAHERALCQAWRDDVAAMTALWTAPAPRAAVRVDFGRFAWREKVAGLRREIALRRRFYPDWIAAARLTAPAAEHQLACLEALLRIYQDGWGWRGSDGALPSQSPAAEAEWRAHCAAVDLARAEQKELELA